MYRAPSGDLPCFWSALKAIATLDVLFFVPPQVEVDYSPVAIATKQQELSAHWNAAINLCLCPQRTRP